MSMDFSVEAVPTGAFVATCYDTDSVLRADSFEEIVDVMGAHKAECSECETYGIYSSAEFDVDVSVNMHNSGASRVVQALGLDWNQVSSEGATLDAQDALERITLAYALLGVVEVAAAPNRVAEAFAAGGARLVNCDNPDDLADRLARVEGVVREALRLGRHVTIT